MRLKVGHVPLGLVIALGIGVAMASPAPSAGQTAEPPPKRLELDVPFVPTQVEATDAMLKLAKVTGEDYVIDLGCGDGRIVIAAAKNCKARAFGVDLDPQRIRESNENAATAGVTDRVKFKLEDIMVTDVREATVVTLFLLDSMNLRLRPKLLSQLRPGARVVSNTFHMADWKPDEVLRHDKAYQGVLNLWIVPAGAGGTWRSKTKTSEGEIASSLELHQAFQVVTGAARFPEGNVPIAKASLTGKQIQLSVTRRVADKEVEIACQGTVDGDTIQGTQKWSAGPSAGTYPWTATRDRVDVAGRWQISAPEHADHNGILTIRREDKGLVATYALDSKPKAEISVPALYVWGSSIRFEVPSDGSPMVFGGDLSPDAGGGNVSFEQAQKPSDKWTAKRLAGK